MAGWPPAGVVSGRSDRRGRTARIVQRRWSVEYDVQRRRLDRVESASGGSGLIESLPRDTYQVSGDDVVHEPVGPGTLSEAPGSEPYGWVRSGGTLTFGDATSDDCADQTSDPHVDPVAGNVTK